MNTNYMEQKSGEKQVIADERSKFEGVLSKTDRGSWTIFPELCKGCGLCIEICPKKVLGFDDQRKAQVERIEDCIGCRQCENICPDLAITVKEQ